VNYRQILTAPNQLTLLRMIFLPFIVISLVKHDFKWALALFILAGLSDGLDGLLARTLHQQTLLGQYLDPIADKLLMSTLFLVLSIERVIPWKFTVVLLLLVEPVRWVWIARTTFLRATFIFTIVSAVHYAFLVQHRLRAPAPPPTLES
jgi:hypothetical protein